MYRVDGEEIALLELSWNGSRCGAEMDGETADGSVIDANHDLLYRALAQAVS